MRFNTQNIHKYIDFIHRPNIPRMYEHFYLQFRCKKLDIELN